MIVGLDGVPLGGEFGDCDAGSVPCSQVHPGAAVARLKT